MQSAFFFPAARDRINFAMETPSRGSFPLQLFDRAKPSCVQAVASGQRDQSSFKITKFFVPLLVHAMLLSSISQSHLFYMRQQMKPHFLVI